MLSDRHCQMLTAYVDGELNARHRTAVQRLIQSSPEARAFLEKLESDSKELRELPAQFAPETLIDSVMHTVCDSPTQPAPRVPEPAPAAASAIPAWLGFALALCLLGMVTAGSFVMTWMLLGERSPGAVVADNPPPAAKGKEAPPVANEIPPTPVVKQKNYDPFLDDMLSGAASRFAAKVDAKDQGVRVVLNEVGEEPVKERLANELKKDAGFALDVPVRSNAQAVEQLTAAFAKSGIKVVMDTAARKGMTSKEPPKTNYVLYAENLRPEELTAILKHLAEVDAGTKQATPTMDRVLLKGMTNEDRNIVAKRLGISPKDLLPPKGPDDLPVVVEIPPDAKVKQGPPFPKERIAVVLPLSGGNLANSPEVKQFLASRQALRPGTVQIMLVIRESA